MAQPLQALAGHAGRGQRQVEHRNAVARVAGRCAVGRGRVRTVRQVQQPGLGAGVGAGADQHDPGTACRPWHVARLDGDAPLSVRCGQVDRGAGKAQRPGHGRQAGAVEQPAGEYGFGHRQGQVEFAGAFEQGAGVQPVTARAAALLRYQQLCGRQGLERRPQRLRPGAGIGAGDDIGAAALREQSFGRLGQGAGEFAHLPCRFFAIMLRSTSLVPPRRL